MLLVVEEHRWIEKLLPLGQNFICSRAFVRLGGVVEGRHLGRRSSSG
jgi:hypothetical protein